MESVGKAWRYLSIYWEAIESSQPFVTRLGDETANSEFTKRLVKDRKRLKKWAETNCFRTMSAPNPEPGTMRVVDDPQPWLFAFLTVSVLLDDSDPEFRAIAFKHHRGIGLNRREARMLDSLVTTLVLRLEEDAYHEPNIVDSAVRQWRRGVIAPARRREKVAGYVEAHRERQACVL